MNAKCNWPRHSDNKAIKIKVNMKRDCVETCCIAESAFTLLALHLQTQYDLGRTNSPNKAWVIHYSCMSYPVCQSSAPLHVLHQLSTFTLCSATWGINRLHLLHPCVCPSDLENNTTPNFLVRPASYRGGQGSPDILRPHQLAVPCWSQWDMPARQGNRGQMLPWNVLKMTPSCCS